MTAQLRELLRIAGQLRPVRHSLDLARALAHDIRDGSHCMNCLGEARRCGAALSRRRELRVRTHEYGGGPIVGTEPQHEASAVLDEAVDPIYQPLQG